MKPSGMAMVAGRLPPILHGFPWAPRQIAVPRYELAAVKWLEKDAHGARRHSDKEKFCSDLNRPDGCKMSERLLKTLRKFADFQAEYEGSIPFTRSISDFNDLAWNLKLLL